MVILLFYFIDDIKNTLFWFGTEDVFSYDWVWRQHHCPPVVMVVNSYAILGIGTLWYWVVMVLGHR
jgi:hypothetical protein